MADAKGPEKLKARKVKGHSTSQMVREGKVTIEDKVGNDQADTAAGRGSNC